MPIQKGSLPLCVQHTRNWMGTVTFNSTVVAFFSFYIIHVALSLWSLVFFFFYSLYIWLCESMHNIELNSAFATHTIISIAIEVGTYQKLLPLSHRAVFTYRRLCFSNATSTSTRSMWCTFDLLPMRFRRIRFSRDFAQLTHLQHIEGIEDSDANVANRRSCSYPHKLSLSWCEEMIFNMFLFINERR